jgi:microcompartment protein CcmK/EutM
MDANAPPNKHDERCIEEGSLDRGTHDVGESHVDLVVVGFVDGQKVLY